MMWLALLVAGCGGASEPTEASGTDGPLQGAVGRVRGIDGQRLLDVDDVELSAGASRSPTDLSGLLVFDQELPGTLGVVGKGQGHTRSGAGAPVVVDRLAAVGVDLLPTETVEGEAVTTAGPFTLELPDGQLIGADGVPHTEPFTIDWADPRGDERWSSPGDSVLLYDDVLEKPVHPHHPFYLQAYDGDDRLRIDEEAVLFVELPEGSPVTEDWRLLQYSFTYGRWTRGDFVTFAPDGRVQVALRNFGWIAFALEDEPIGCVTGTVEADGAPVDGAEVRLLEPGVLGATRGWTDGGRFCAPLSPGATADARLLWFASNFRRMGAATTTVTHPGGAVGDCGSDACVDIGVIDLVVAVDADDDHYFSGPGGDCDDADPDVNPTAVYGDGSWCGE